MVETSPVTIAEPCRLPLGRIRAAAPRQVPQAHPWPAFALLLGKPGTAEAGRHAVAFLLLMVAALLLRATAFMPSVINPDESLYAVQAQAWLRGGWPYVAVWDMHPVGAPALFVLAFGLFGENLASLRLLGAVAVAGAGFALYRAVLASGTGRAIGLAAGLLYVAGSALLDGLATNTEILLAPFLGLAMALGLAAARRALVRGWPPALRQVVAAGLLVGLALLVKPVVVPQGCLAFLVLVGPALGCGALPWRRLPGLALAYALACATPMALVALAYALRGDFTAFLDGNVLAPLRYVAMGVPFAQALRLCLAAAATLLLPLLLALGTLLPPPRPRPAQQLLARTALAWLAAAGLAVVLPGMYFPHYFLMLLAPLALLAALGAGRLARVARPGLVLASFAGLLAVATLQCWSMVLLPRLEHGIGLRGQDPPQRVAAALNAALRPGESIFVVNWQPLLYFLTRTQPPTRFVHPAQLSGRFAAVTGVDPDAELARLLATRPRFIVLDSGRWGQVRPAAQALVTRALEQAYAPHAQMPAEDGSLVELWELR